MLFENSSIERDLNHKVKQMENIVLGQTIEALLHMLKYRFSITGIIYIHF